MTDQAKQEIYRRYVEYCERCGIPPATQQEYEFNLKLCPAHEGR